MAIRIRVVDGHTIAICAAKSTEKDGDIYLDDNAHHALCTKLDLDWLSEVLLGKSLADEKLVPLMESVTYLNHGNGLEAAAACLGYSALGAHIAVSNR